ncbi:zinc ribbon domain-containing protein [Streptomyces sp. NPDC058066]|uniref:zinc ribbon domain-containing protein n=1 Tax=Streptomyces sp. NPDC058066 TaxID=3346323 RepID=UPI0036E6936E
MPRSLGVRECQQEPAQCPAVTPAVDQGLFICRGCGVVAHADRNASHNIARKGEAVWTAGRESRVPATPSRGVWTEGSIPAASRALPPSPVL